VLLHPVVAGEMAADAGVDTRELYRSLLAHRAR
jgi:hypothetical protein